MLIIVKNNDSHAELRNIALHAGGACAIAMVDKTAVGEWMAVISAAAPDKLVTPDSRYILVLEELTEYLTPAELAAVIAHEEGHIALGHTDGIGESGIIDNSEFEFDADAYAIKKIGSAYLLHTALTKMEDFLIEVVVPGITGEEEISDELRILVRESFETTVSPRLRRMEEMM